MHPKILFLPHIIYPRNLDRCWKFTEHRKRFFQFSALVGISPPQDVGILEENLFQKLLSALVGISTPSDVGILKEKSKKNHFFFQKILLCAFIGHVVADLSDVILCKIHSAELLFKTHLCNDILLKHTTYITQKSITQEIQ